MRWWKVLGVAAFIGVAATGVLVERAERARHDYTPEQIRERLHARAAEAPAAGGAAPDLVRPLWQRRAARVAANLARFRAVATRSAARIPHRPGEGPRGPATGRED